MSKKTRPDKRDVTGVHRLAVLLALPVLWWLVQHAALREALQVCQHTVYEQFLSQSHNRPELERAITLLLHAITQFALYGFIFMEEQTLPNTDIYFDPSLVE